MIQQHIGEQATEPGLSVWWVATRAGDVHPKQVGEGPRPPVLLSLELLEVNLAEVCVTACTSPPGPQRGLRSSGSSVSTQGRCGCSEVRRSRGATARDRVEANPGAAGARAGT
ncbi:unnamed protein product [Prorocentrum cordatum]|uniref:Uncharacterized protein n=1 Tax=Prorocentrum cordatum TaxID=2364126 RepID=A0ABN9X3V1_9DINO|nr:unnamed protein product [Polarella glacialis]